MIHTMIREHKRYDYSSTTLESMHSRHHFTQTKVQILLVVQIVQYILELVHRAFNDYELVGRTSMMYDYIYIYI